VKPRTALVTGANRGLGFETARQLGQLGYRVIATGRDLTKAERAAETLRGEGLDVTAFELDVASDGDAAGLAELGPIDALVNNAGIIATGTGTDRLREAFETNTLGAYRTIQALAPGMRERAYGRIVNVSSGMGQLAEMGGGNPAYRVSKTGLNALTRIFASELAGSGVLVNSVCPGWVRTEMGGPSAPRTVEEGVETIVWAATLPGDGPSGGFFRNKQPIPW
jgi:NAD(P)-dependent dehydrogenase (short-subunit alcohol dehydrogenase family)